ncbi:putative metallophosphoesterase [Flagellimonas maritima]|uniref:Putative metallophosphoesterase n=1 Tax=Flagellimonas maritima TaxID=1383885 RepID=A0A2Z4LTN1_9FLAO|nr:metallophosphoesterase [Allomuricauda aurantiaca]AWX45089.1 putative metallophosphoesterase [Allomuricauda aurantiaca]
MRIFIAITFLVFAYYTFQAIRTLVKNSVVRIIYWVLIAVVLTYFVFEIALDISNVFIIHEKLMGFALFLALYIFLMLTSFSMLFEDIVRFGNALIKMRKSETFTIPSRRGFISKFALGIAAIPFSTLVYSIYKGRYNFRIFDYLLTFEDLPQNFNDYKIVHISDFHCGGLDNYDEVRNAIKLINDQQADMILFTGDFVDRRANEIDDWKSLFSSLKAKDGKYSILGNHDYANYVDWPTLEEKQADFELLKRHQKEMGFDLLCNENRILSKNGQNLSLIGVEYWGYDSLLREGDLDQAFSGLETESFKIVMTHDPTHWQYRVVDHEVHIPLTLCGHTHGMQFGIEVPGKFKWTPVRHGFKYWAGLYKEKNQYLNVNRGFGYAGFPGRLGIWPEISVITLKKSNS